MVYIFQLGRVNSREKGRKENVPSMPCRSILHRELGTQKFVPVLQRYQIKENIVIVKKAWSIPAGSGKPSLENIHGSQRARPSNNSRGLARLLHLLQSHVPEYQHRYRHGNYELTKTPSTKTRLCCVEGREPKETKIVNPVKVSFNPR